MDKLPDPRSFDNGNDPLRHFKEVKPAAIPPGKVNVNEGFDPETLTSSLDKYWQYKGQRYYDTYQTGKMLASGATKTNIDVVLNDFTKLIEDGIKNANSKTGITNENLRDHFLLLSQSLKVLASAVKANYARNSRESTVDDIQFNHQELLAILSGYITAKVYANK